MRVNTWLQHHAKIAQESQHHVRIVQESFQTLYNHNDNNSLI